MSNLEKEEAEIIALRLENLLMFLLCLLLFYVGDAHGYHNDSPVKLLDHGEVWLPLEGSGHSLSTVAAGLGALEFASLFDINPQTSAGKKAIGLAVLLTIYEILAPDTVADPKDVAVTIGAAGFLYLFERFLEKGSDLVLARKS